MLTGVTDVLRTIARAGIAGAIAGVVVGGLGGRVVMRLAALIDPTSLGRRTENGNLIGDITAEGTLALLVFGGLLSGLVAGVIWVAVGPWVPGRGLRRAVATGLIAVALAGFMLVQGDNPDFLILKADEPVILMLLVLVAALGATLVVIDEALDRRLPRAIPGSIGLFLLYGIVSLIGAVLIAPFAIGGYLSRDLCGCNEPPTAVGIALLATGGATVAWWILRVRGSSRPPARVVLVGRSALVAAVVLGTIRLAEEVSTAIATG